MENADVTGKASRAAVPSQVATGSPLKRSVLATLSLRLLCLPRRQAQKEAFGKTLGLVGAENGPEHGHHVSQMMPTRDSTTSPLRPPPLHMVKGHVHVPKSSQQTAVSASTEEHFAVLPMALGFELMLPIKP